MTYFGDIEIARACSFGELVLARYHSHPPTGKHSHTTAYVSLCLDGGYVEAFNDGLDELGRGDLLVHPANELHADVWCRQGATILALQVTPPIQRLFGVEATHGKRVRARCIDEKLRRLERLLTSDGGRSDTLDLLCAAELLLPWLAVETKGIRDRGGGLKRAKSAMEAFPERNWPLADLAAIAGYQRTYFAEKFDLEYGCPPGEYLRRLRLRHALKLIAEEGASLTDAAHACGFFDSAHMTRTFRRMLGMPPSRLA